MKRRLLKVLAVLLILALLSTLLSIAATASEQSMSMFSNVRVTVNGSFVDFEDVQPQMRSRRVLVPVRGVFEYMGFVVEWVPEARMATLATPDYLILIPAAGSYFMVNNNQITPDVPQQLVNGRLMLPLRAIAEAVGGDAHWDEVNRIAIITTQGYETGVTPTPQATPTPTPQVTPSPSPEPTQPPELGDGNGEPMVFYEPALFTNTELQDMARIAFSPYDTDTRSIMTLPERYLSESELSEWITGYVALGGVNAFELEVVRLVNIERERVGARPLAICPYMMMAARFKTQEILDLNYFAHDSPVYGHFSGIPRLFGITVGGENLSGGRQTPDDVVQAWMNSDGHRRNMLNPNHRLLGIGNIERITTFLAGSGWDATTQSYRF